MATWISLVKLLSLSIENALQNSISVYYAMFSEIVLVIGMGGGVWRLNGVLIEAKGSSDWCRKDGGD